MNSLEQSASSRRPRFRRASDPPIFRLTENDVAIIRLLARHRFLRSIHIAALVGRSLDRTNHRLSRLFHAGYIDRPRAQLDYYPTAGSAPMAYALADRGAQLLSENDGLDLSKVDWSRKNRGAGRPFIEHQLEVMDFHVSLQCAARSRNDVRLISADEIVASFPIQSNGAHPPVNLEVKISYDSAVHEVGLIPDLVFGLEFADGSRRCFMVEVDRGTMPIVRRDIRQTSFERKMRAYLTAHATKAHERHFGWKTFRVLTITTDNRRMQSMIDSLCEERVPHSPGPLLFLFTERNKLCSSDPLTHIWHDGTGREVRLI